MFCVLFNTDKLELNLIRKKIPTQFIKKEKIMHKKIYEFMLKLTVSYVNVNVNV